MVTGAFALGGLIGLLGFSSLAFAEDEEKTPDVWRVDEEDKDSNYFRVKTKETILEEKKDPTCSLFQGPSGGYGQNGYLSFIIGDRGANSGITKIIVYENNEPIEIREGDFQDGLWTGTKLFHDTLGEFRYYVEVTDKDTNVARSCTTVINFTGEVWDSAPKILFYDILDHYSGAEISFSFNDFRDNPGIKELVLYEDMKPIMTFECNSETRCKSDVSLFEFNKSQGTHIYYVEAEDLGGNKRRTDLMIIEYMSHQNK